MARHGAWKILKSVFIGILAVMAVYIAVMVAQNIFKKFAVRDSRIDDATSSQHATLLSDGCDPKSITTSSFINDKGNYVVASTGKDNQENTVTYFAEYDSKNNYLISKTKTIADKNGKTAILVWKDNFYGENKGGWKEVDLPNKVTK